MSFRAELSGFEYHHGIDGTGWPDAVVVGNGALGRGYESRRYLPEVAEWDRETCRFVPDVLATRYDDDGNEVDTEEPGAGCAAFCCSACGFPMLFGEFDSWFDYKPPYTPRFRYCPNCGRKVGR